MNKQESKKIIELIKKSREMIGDDYNELSKKVDSDLKEKLNDQQYKAWIAANSSKENEQMLIEEIGNERYSELLSELNKILLEQLNK